MAATQAGLAAGMALAQARALAPGLLVRPADPAADAALLRRLAEWCLRYAPLAAVDGTHGLWIDITGTAHLFGGETRLLRDLLGRLERQGLTGKAAIAETPGAAWALARFGEPSTIIPVGATATALAPLPIEALRLCPETARDLRLLGFERIGDLAATPRAPLMHRFGPLPLRRLDQAHGVVFEPITPLVPTDLIQARLVFVEPLLTPDSLATVIERLTTDVCTALERAGKGARQLDLLFERMDGVIPTIRIGAARASRDPRHLTRMLQARLDRIDPGLGIEAMGLIATRVDPLSETPTLLTEAGTARPDLSPLVDRLINRFGADRIHRFQPVASHMPQRSVRRVDPLDGGKAGWPTTPPRPVRLLDPPQPVDVMTLLPDDPPVAFIWRRKRHRLRRIEGPERVAGEWWKRAEERHAIRDFYRVEDEEGRRFWLFRHGDGPDIEIEDGGWFLQGFF